MRRLFAGVALVTCSTLLLEILLTRIFSYTLYYHFAFLVISLALFGLGVSGVVLYVLLDTSVAGAHRSIDDLAAQPLGRLPRTAA